MVFPLSPSHAGDSTMNQLLEAALGYATRGWAVFPLHHVEDGRCSCHNPKCSSPGKHPLTPHGVKDATTNPEQIQQWWSTFPQANIGIACGAVSGGLVVVDWDLESDLTPFEQWCRGRIRPLVKTPRGGRHAYLSDPKHRIKSYKHKHGEVRSDGYYVVAPPSNHLRGVYQWI